VEIGALAGPARQQSWMRNLGLGVVTVGSLLAFASVSGAQQSPQPVPPVAPAKQPKPLEIPADQRPPKGLCRNWIDNVPADRQPAITDCPTALKNKTQSERTIFGDDYDTTPTPAPDKVTPAPTVPTTVPISRSTTVPMATFPPIKPPPPRRRHR